MKKLSRAQQLKNLIKPNIFLVNWMEVNIYKPTEDAVKGGKAKDKHRIRMTPYKLEEFAKVGGTIAIMKQLANDEGFDIVEEQGWREFNDADQDSEDVVLKIQW